MYYVGYFRTVEEAVEARASFTVTIEGE